MTRSILFALSALFIFSTYVQAHSFGNEAIHEGGGTNSQTASIQRVSFNSIPKSAYKQTIEEGSLVFTHLLTGTILSISQKTWEGLTSPKQKSYSITSEEFNPSHLPKDIQLKLKEHPDTKSSFMLFEKSDLSPELEATMIYTLDLQKLMHYAKEDSLFVTIATFFSRYDNQQSYISSKCTTRWLKMAHHKELWKEKAQTFWQHNQFRITGLFYMSASLTLDYTLNSFLQSDTLDHYPPLSTLYAGSMVLQLFNHRDKRDAIQALYALMVYGFNHFKK